MNPDAVVILIPITLILTTGAVLLFRPITKRLGYLLEAMAKERTNPELRKDLEDELARVREMQDLLAERMALLEEKQDFTDSLLRSSSTQDASALPRPARAERPSLME